MKYYRVGKSNLKVILIIIVLLIVLGGIIWIVMDSSSKKMSGEDVLTSDYQASIRLQDNNSTIEGSGASVNGDVITITQAGKYYISGSLSDGQIIVDATSNDEIELVLDSVDITSKTSSPIYIKQSKSTTILLADGTVNELSDTKDFVYTDVVEEEPNATIYSKDDLYFTGNGALNLSSNFNDAIGCSDSVVIESGNISIVSVDHGIRAKDGVTIKGGVTKIEASGDGIKTKNTEESDKGNIVVEGGELEIIATQDGFDSANGIYVSGGDLNITTGGGSQNASTKESWGMWQTSTTTEESTSAKGIKANALLEISGGNISIDSSDDSLHSNNDLTISGGTLSLSSGDDGIHADSEIIINDGSIEITKSYEGIESTNITIENGAISIVSSDDGINICGGNDSSSLGGRPGQNMFEATDGELTIHGGTIYVNASGDGLDSNGNIVMTGGTVLVDGPVDGGNGALDYNGTFDISGGTLIAVGSREMAQSLSSSSTQASILINLTQEASANQIIHLQNSNGEEIITYAPSKKYSSIVVSTPNIKQNESVEVYLSGSHSGTNTNGLYTGGSYTSGELLTTIQITGILNSYGSGGMMNNMPGGNMGMPGGMR